MRPNFGPFRSTTSSFEDIAHLYKKMPQNFKFHYSFNNFGDTFPKSVHAIWGTNLVCSFSRDVF